MELQIDNREHIKLNFSDNINKNIINLDIGDYIIKNNDNIFMVIERKTLSDYAASIKDGRNREQKKRLLDKYDNIKIIYLIEGNFSFENSSFKYSKISNETIISSMINTMLRDKINLVHTSSPKETVFFIETLYKKFEKQGMKFLENKSCYEDDLFNYSKKQLPKNKIDKEMCHKLMLSCIPDLSLKTAERILMNFHTLKNFINTLESLPDEQRVNYIQNLPSNDEKFRKISKNVAENIINLLL